MTALDAVDRRLVVALQAGLPLAVDPWAKVAEDVGLEETEVLERVRRMREQGVIRRIAAVPNHYRLGMTANGMSVWDVEDGEADRLGILPVGPRSGGINTIAVDFTVNAIRITGSIIVSDGALIAEVMSPSGAVVFTTSVEAPGEVKIDKFLPVEEGEWRMRYFSLNGTGFIHLHLSLIR